MADFSLQKHGTDNHDLKAEKYDYVIIMGKSHGGMRFGYTMIDPETQTLAPKLNTIVWSRLIDTVNFATCVFKNCMYVFGGIEKSTGKVCRVVQKYDPYIGRWKQCEDMKMPRAGHCAAVIFGKIYVFGGMVSGTEITDTCESYEPLMDEWRIEENLPEPRKDHACVVTDSNVYILGGASPTRVANDNIWVLARHFPDATQPSVFSLQWLDLPDPKQTQLGYKLCRHSVAICQDRMYVIGGVSHGKTVNGKTVLRTQSPDKNKDTSQLENGSRHVDSNENSTEDLKWLIATSPVIESYKFHAPVPDFGIDADFEEAKIKEREAEEMKRNQEEKKRQQEEKKRQQRNRLRNKRGKKGTQKEDKEAEERRIREEEEARKREEEQWRKEKEEQERLRNRTFWNVSLPDMPEPRCSAGTCVIGKKIYVIGGHKVEDDTRSSIRTIEYFHAKRKEWVSAFDFSKGDFSEVDCCILTVPITNNDFKPVRYTGCKWVMW